jgi:hypothetical protein
LSIFDTPIDRRHSDSIKWSKYAGRDILPLWVADMDFAAPPAVLDALQQRIAHGVFGYGGAWPSLTESVLAHLETEYSWSIEAEWIVWLPGLVSGLQHCLPGSRRRGADGDADLSPLSFRAAFFRPPAQPLSNWPAKRWPLALGQNCPEKRVDRSNPAFPALPPAQPGWPLLEPRRVA